MLPAMRRAAEVEAEAQAPINSPNKRRRGRTARQGGAWQPWQHDGQVLAKGGRLAKELHQESVDCYLVRMWGEAKECAA